MTDLDRVSLFLTLAFVAFVWLGLAIIWSYR